MKRFLNEKTIFALLIGLFYLPVFYVFLHSLSLPNFIGEIKQLVTSPIFRNTLSFSISESALSAALSILFALPGAYFLGRFTWRGKNLWRSTLVLPFMMPGIIIVLALIVFYGQNGVFNQMLQSVFHDSQRFSELYSFKGIILAHVIYNLPLALRMLGERWEGIDVRLREASVNLGAGPFFTWFKLTLPLILPTLVYVFLLIFLYSFLSFTIVLLFGGYLYKTFEVLIYIEYNNKLRFDIAALYAVLQTAFLLILFFVQMWIQRRLSQNNQEKSVNLLPRLEFSKNPRRFLFFAGYHSLLLLFLALPFLSLIIRSFSTLRDGRNIWSFDNYQRLLAPSFQINAGEPLLQILCTSLALAVCVGLITVLTTYYLAKQRRQKPWGLADLLLQLPLGISFMSFGIGLSILSDICFVPAVIQIIAAQMFLTFPLVYSIMRTAWQNFDYSLTESGILLGNDKGYHFFHLELPLFSKTLKTALAYAMAISLSDLSAVLLLGKGKIITLTVAVYRLIGHYHFAEAIALGCVFMLIALGLFSMIEINRAQER